MGGSHSVVSNDLKEIIVNQDTVDIVTKLMAEAISETDINLNSKCIQDTIASSTFILNIEGIHSNYFDISGIKVISKISDAIAKCVDISDISLKFTANMTSKLLEELESKLSTELMNKLESKAASKYKQTGIAIPFGKSSSNVSSNINIKQITKQYTHLATAISFAVRDTVFIDQNKQCLQDNKSVGKTILNFSNSTIKKIVVSNISVESTVKGVTFSCFIKDTTGYDLLSKFANNLDMNVSNTNTIKATNYSTALATAMSEVKGPLAALSGNSFMVSAISSGIVFVVLLIILLK